jgi:DNA primase
MVNRRNNEWERDSEVYTSAQVEAIANYCDIEVVSETATHFQAYCPFHNNTDDPAFVVDKKRGLWHCFNPSCGSSGNLESLLRSLKGLNPFEAKRVILKYEKEVHESIADRLSAIREKAPDFVEFPSEPVQRMASDLWTPAGEAGLVYLKGRGFNDDTLKHFGVGYSLKKEMTTVPMHDPKGMLVGFVGRSIEGKEFKNTPNLPKSKTAWNFHRAKTHGEVVIVVESSFDAMRIHQAGYQNVIALLGGHATAYHLEQISRTFSTVIIMTDFDKKIYRPNCRKCLHLRECAGHRPGRELGWSIANGLPDKTIKWAAWDDENVYPHMAKDAGDMTDDEIRHCLTHTVSHFEYSRWGIDDKELLAS